jgi:adenylate kinase
MFIKIGGVSGSGKTTVVPLFVSRLEELGYRTERIKGGEIMAASLGLSDPHELDNMHPEEVLKKVRIEAYLQLYQKDRKEIPTIRVRDGHYTVVQRDELGSISINQVDLMPGDFTQMGALFILEPSREIIVARRVLDAIDRIDRNIDDLVLLDDEMRLERQTAEKQAASLGIGLNIFENETDPNQTCYLMCQALQENPRFNLEAFRNHPVNVGVERYY